MSDNNKHTGFFFWFYRQHRQEVINLLEAIENPPNSIKPTRKLILLPYLLEEKKLKNEKEFDKLVQYLINAEYADRSDSGALNLTNEGRKLLTQYAEFGLLRPMKIIQNSLKENLSAILASIAFSSTPENCNMNGTWYLDLMPAYQFHIVQSGSSVIITTPTWPPGSELYGAGSVMTWGAEFYLSSHGSIVNYFRGVFINSCFSMVWGAYNHDGNLEEFTMLRVPIEIVAPVGNELIITSEPRMPSFEAKAIMVNPAYKKNINANIPAFTWGIKIHHDIGSDLHINAYLDNIAGDDESYRPNFNSLKEVLKNGDTVNIPGFVVGGELTISVDYYQNLHIEKKYTLKGTNPGQVAIEQLLTDKTLQQIACQESHYKQFIAHREGGVGTLNTKPGSRGGIGIMQLFEPIPTSAQAWNWRENIKAGVDLFNEKRVVALSHPKIELNDLNKERKVLGLPICKKELPPLTQEQLAREIVRLYNCGFEYRWEPRDATNCEGKWIVSPSCAVSRPKAYDKDYVNNVFKCDINH